MRSTTVSLVGERFGRFLVIGVGIIVYHGKNRTPFETRSCRCDCGTVRDVLVQSLLNGRSRSCGCLRKEIMGKRMREYNARAAGDPTKNARWKGGRRKDKRGYMDVWIARNDPFFCMARSHTPNGGYVFEHRLVLARHLGRPLTEDEEVHHVNGDRACNEIGNLQLRQLYHGAGSVFQCRHCGSFDVVAKKL